jgi:hypothetical protein
LCLIQEKYKLFNFILSSTELEIWKFSTVCILFFYVVLMNYISSMTHALQKYCTVHECSCSAAWILQTYWHHLRSFCNKPWLKSVLVLATRTATITRPQCRRANPWDFPMPRDTTTAPHCIRNITQLLHKKLFIFIFTYLNSWMNTCCAVS